MAPDSPPQMVLAGRNLRAELFAISGDERFSLISKMQGLTGDGAAVLFEEPASAAIRHPGDLLLSILCEGRLRMAYISKVDVGGAVGSEDEGRIIADADEDEEDGGRISTEDEEERGSSSPKVHEEWGIASKQDVEDKEQSRQNSGSNLVTVSEDKDELLDTEDDVNESNRCLQIRVWPEYCVLVLFEGECWKLTKQQPIQWLQKHQMEEIHQRYITENERIEINTSKLAFVDLSKQIGVLGFTGYLECSKDVENFLNTELNPDMANYKINKVLGSGATCKVYGVDAEYALKKMELTQKFDDTDALKSKEPREIIILSSFRCSPVVTFFQAWAVDGTYKSYLEGSSDDSTEDFDDEYSESDNELEDGREPRYVAIQMELCGRTLRDFLDDDDREMDVELAWYLFKETVKGVQLIHRSGVIHRDLKPQNIFFGYAGRNAIKIGDFGHACWAKQYAAGEAGTPNRGTSGYCAPELGTKATATAPARNAETPTEKADMYSLGIILLELFHIFGSSHERFEVFDKLKTGEYPNSPDWYGDDTLLRKLTALSPSERLSASETLEYISNIIQIADLEVH